MKDIEDSMNRQVKCDKVVKEVLKKYSHSKCTCAKRRIYSVGVSGKVLNNYLINHRRSGTDPTRFNSRKKYNICSNLYESISRANNTNTPEQDDGTPSLLCVETVSSKKAPHRKIVKPKNDEDEERDETRAQRLFMRQRIAANDPELKGVKKVNVSIGNEKYQIETTKMRVRQKDRFRNEVLDSYYKVPFGHLSMRQRRLRMAKIGKELLGACIERQQFKTKTDEYLHGNKKLAVEILNLLDGVKEYIQSKMKIDFDALNDVAVVPIENDAEGFISKLDEEKKSHKLAISLLGETTTRGYERLRSSIANYTELPSYYKITKDRPTIVPIDIRPICAFDDDSAVVDFDDMQQYHHIENEEYELEVALRNISERSEKDKLDGAVIEGEYEDYVRMLEEKHEGAGRNIDNESDVFVLDSFDGAEHLRSKKKITSVISFSSSLTSGAWINGKDVTAGSSLNILTWQQIRGKESIHTMIPAVENYFHEKKRLRDETEKRNYHFYDIHDGKMLYLLTQHSQWSRKNNPFLLCTCGKGEGVKANQNHVCKKVSHQGQIDAYDRSTRRWDLKRSRDENYSVKEHSAWVDEKNDGISHFGLHPDLFPRDGIRFDTFHMKCAITRKLMGYMRRFLLNQSTDLLDQFINDVLKKFWNDFHLYVWKNKKNFSSFLGNELALFVANTQSIVSFLESNFVQTNEIEDMKKSLLLWVEIFKFLGMTVVQNGDTYKNEQVNKFEDNLKEFYDCGSRTFLSSQGTTNGNEETFYSHALRFYMMDIVNVTFERHKVGVGIFNMQGFERRNKESKNCMKRFCNHRGNVCVSNMKRLIDVFKHDINAA